ncbi:MAG: hypothetical protein N2C14_17095, partial [Planctomycetales bacterium]
MGRIGGVVGSGNAPGNSSPRETRFVESSVESIWFRKASSESRTSQDNGSTQDSRANRSSQGNGTSGSSRANRTSRVRGGR